MTNDTNTLNGALMELGELMASNLNIMGVDDAIPQNGLTTLANKILNIQSININIMSFVVNGDINIQDFNPIYNGDNLVILWGDKSYSRYIDGALQYTYDDERNEHIVYIIGDIIELGDNCFNACTNITSISIPDSVTSFGSACFNGCTSLVDIDIPNSLISFGYNCFASCANLTEIIIPDGVIDIGDYCFYNCAGLEFVSIPSSVISIGDYCFKDCIIGDYELYWTGEDILEYDSSKMPAGASTIFTIPQGETENYITAGYPADKLRERRVSQMVVLEYTGADIALGFDNQQWLPSTGDVIVDWGDGTTDTVNDPTTKLSHSYTDGINNHTIKLIGEITSLGIACFMNCTGLTEVTIPESVTSLGISCFMNCTGLTSIVIPDSVNSLSDDCFGRCTSLTEVIIPNTVTSLGEFCFAECTSLTEVTIPESVTNLGFRCFFGCTGLVDYQLYWDTPPISYNSQDMPVNTGTVFTIPAGTMDNYVNKGFPADKIQERGGGLTPTILLLSSNGDISVGESVTLTGTLLDNNNNAVAGASVKIYQDSVLLDSVTTDSDGEYSKTVTGLTADSYSFKSMYDGDSTYDASESSVVSVTVHSYDIDISTTTPIVQNGSTATIVATLTHNGGAVSGQTLSYQIKHGNTVIDSGTDTTRIFTGQISFTYLATGVGDVDIIVSWGSLLQETFALEDCWYTSSMTSDDGKWVWGSVPHLFSSNGVTLTTPSSSGDYIAYCDLSNSFDGDYEVSATVTTTQYPKPFLCPYNCMSFVNISHQLILADMNTGYSGYSSVYDFNDKNTMEHRFTVIGNVVTLYVDDVQILQKTVANPSEKIQLWQNRVWDLSYTIKDIKVKAL